MPGLCLPVTSPADMHPCWPALYSKGLRVLLAAHMALPGMMLPTPHPTPTTHTQLPTPLPTMQEQPLQYALQGA